MLQAFFLLFMAPSIAQASLLDVLKSTSKPAVQGGLGSGFEMHYNELNAKAWLCQAHDMENSYWHAIGKTPLLAKRLVYDLCFHQSHYKYTCQIKSENACRPANSTIHTCIVKNTKTGQVWTQDSLHHVRCNTVLETCQHRVNDQPKLCVIVDKF